MHVDKDKKNINKGMAFVPAKNSDQDNVSI